MYCDGDVIMRVVSRFKKKKNSGEKAELYLRKKYFPHLDLKFRKIRKDKVGRKPEGWILEKGQKIALAEIKLIEYQTKSKGSPNFSAIHVDRTVQKTISYAKKQLVTIKTKLPKLLYLIADETFVDADTILDAIFGPWTITERAGKIIFQGPRGINPSTSKKYKQDQKFSDNLLTAIICYIPHTDGHRIWLFENRSSIQLPNILRDKKNLEEFWVYNNKPHIILKKEKV